MHAGDPGAGVRPAAARGRRLRVVQSRGARPRPRGHRRAWLRDPFNPADRHVPAHRARRGGRGADAMIWRVAAVLLAIALAVTARVAVRHAREVPPPPAPAVHASIDARDGAELGTGDTIL